MAKPSLAEVRPTTEVVAPDHDSEAAVSLMTPELATEIEQLEFRKLAMDNLAAERKARSNVAYVNAVLEGVEDFEDENLSLAKRAQKSSAAASRLIEVGKANFARSIGIDASVADRHETFGTQKVYVSSMLVFKDPSKWRAFQPQYREFRKQYYGKPKALKRRRNEIRAEIQAKQHEATGDQVPKVVQLLNSTRGVIDTDSLPKFNVDPDSKTNIADLSVSIGEALSKEKVKYRTADRRLWVYRNDLKRTTPKQLHRGLYVEPSDPRYRQTERLIIVRNGWLDPEFVGLEGVVDPRVGVAAGDDEFRSITRSAFDLVKHMQARTRDANKANDDREDVRERVKRSGGHIMEDMLHKLGVIDLGLVDLGNVLERILDNSQDAHQPAYLTKDLNRDRKESDEFMHEIIEVVGVSFNYGTVVLNAMHRALDSRLYRRGSAANLAAARHTYTNFAIRYVNAKRGKVNESQNACSLELAKYIESLAAADSGQKSNDASVKTSLEQPKRG